MAGILSSAEAAQLEGKLVAFDQQTSNQIAVVILNDLMGYDKAELAYRIGESWGVGQEGFNNGVVILLKPKTGESRGEVFIATGYGLEGAIPDAIGRRIVEQEMIPHFRNNDYFGGLDAATTVLMGLAKGEISQENYREEPEPGMSLIVLIILIILVIIIFRNRKRQMHSIGGDIPWWFYLPRGGSGSSWGGFGGRGGGGGFGGFGGGSFGGGGAGGSW